MIDRKGQVHSMQCSSNPRLSPCIFEFVYFARPDSIIDNISVYKSRLRMGEKLANKIKSKWPDEKIDVVIPIPDTSRTAALQLANALEVKYREGFIKNRYIARTFIMPGQKQRKKSVRQKLSAIELEFKDKNVLLVDDSIVRGTTSKEIVQMARSSGAKKVFFASAAPPVRYPNVYGIDMASKNECSDSCHGADIILSTTFLKRMQSESLNLEIQYSLIDRKRPTPKVRKMKPSKASFGKISKTKTFKKSSHNHARQTHPRRLAQLARILDGRDNRSRTGQSPSCLRQTIPKGCPL